MIIDFSAHSKWDYCAAAWFERYINKLELRPTSAQRDDALTLGSLVHEGLRVWQQSKRVEIPTNVVDETNPTKECYDLALELVSGYAQAYPEEQWPLVRCEEPVTKVLINTSTDRDAEGDLIIGNIPLILLAKIDSYFYVPEPTTIESGQPGLQFTLSPGWWIHEYKTKHPSVSLATFMQRWETDMQASYQMIALEQKIGEKVQGVLVNVLEKPKRHVPKRKCKTCQESYEFATWIPTGTGQYSCPVCGSRQTLMPLKENPVNNPPAYYRIIATRTPDKLKEDEAQIIQVGRQMIEMAQGGLYSFPHRKGNCVDTKWNRQCEYRGSHLNNNSTVGDGAYQPTKEYRGLVVL